MSLVQLWSHRLQSYPPQMDGYDYRMATASEKLRMKFPSQFSPVGIEFELSFFGVGGGWLAPDWQHLLIRQVDSGDAAVSVVWSELQLLFMVHLHPRCCYTLAQGSATWSQLRRWLTWLVQCYLAIHISGAMASLWCIWLVFPLQIITVFIFTIFFHHPWALQSPPDIHPPPSTSSSAARKHLLHIISQFTGFDGLVMFYKDVSAARILVEVNWQKLKAHNVQNSLYELQIWNRF